MQCKKSAGCTDPGPPSYGAAGLRTKFGSSSPEEKKRHVFARSRLQHLYFFDSGLQSNTEENKRHFYGFQAPKYTKLTQLLAPQSYFGFQLTHVTFLSASTAQ